MPLSGNFLPAIFFYQKIWEIAKLMAIEIFAHFLIDDFASDPFWISLIYEEDLLINIYAFAM